MKGINITSANWTTRQIITAVGLDDCNYAEIDMFLKEKGASVELLNLYSGYKYAQIRAGVALGMDFEYLNNIREVSIYVGGVFGLNNTIVLRAIKKLKKQIKNFDINVLKNKVERDFLAEKYNNIFFTTNLNKIITVLAKTYKTK